MGSMGSYLGMFQTSVTAIWNSFICELTAGTFMKNSSVPNSARSVVHSVALQKTSRGNIKRLLEEVVV